MTRLHFLKSRCSRTLDTPGIIWPNSASPDTEAWGLLNRIWFWREVWTVPMVVLWSGLNRLTSNNNSSNNNNNNSNNALVTPLSCLRHLPFFSATFSGRSIMGGTDVYGASDDSPKTLIITGRVEQQSRDAEQKVSNFQQRFLPLQP